MARIGGGAPRRIILIALMFSAIGAFAAAPAKIFYRGKITDSAGVPINASGKRVDFAFFNINSGGTPLGSQAVTGLNIVNGVFEAYITVDASVFQANPDVFVEVTYDGKKFTPRQRLVSVPYAFAVAAGAVGSAEIKEGSITNADIKVTSSITEKIPTGKLSGPVTAIGGHGLGTLATITSVTANDIQDGAITYSKLAVNAVDTDNIFDSTITARILQGNPTDNGSRAVLTDRLANLAVSSRTLALDAVDYSKVSPGAISTEDIGDVQISSRVLRVEDTGNSWDAAVTKDHIRDGAVTSRAIATNAVTTSKVKDLKGKDVGDGQILSSVLRVKDAGNGWDAAVTKDHIKDGAITGRHLNSSSARVGVFKEEATGTLYREGKCPGACELVGYLIKP